LGFSIAQPNTSFLVLLGFVTSTQPTKNKLLRSLKQGQKKTDYQSWGSPLGCLTIAGKPNTFNLVLYSKFGALRPASRRS